MSRLMNRKQWLETFLKLADSNADNIQYRQKLGLRAQKLPNFVKNIPAYRAELKKILEQEAEEKLREQRKEVGGVRVKRTEDSRHDAGNSGNLEGQGKKGEDQTGNLSIRHDGLLYNENNPKRNKETLGTREDNSEN